MYQWIFITGIFVAFYNAWGIGANDCANSFATSVGAKVLTLKHAIIIAAIFEFSGAVLMGSHVTDMVRKKIVSNNLFEDDPGTLMFGMLCADLSSAIWLTVATYFKLPVSTTHSIIGAIVGFSLSYGGKDAVNWKKIWLVVVSWVASPFIAGIFSFIFFTLINNIIFKSKNPKNRLLLLFPILIFFTFFINTLFIIYKGSPQLDLDEMPFWQCFLISFGVSVFTSILAQIMYVPYVKRKLQLNSNNSVNLSPVNTLEIQDNSVNNITSTNGNNNGNNNNNEIKICRTKSYSEATTHFNCEELNTESSTDIIPEQTIENGNDSSNDLENENKDLLYDNNINIKNNIVRARKHIKRLESIKLEKEIEEHHKNALKLDPKADELCSWIQIITACFSSFAHGSNDVANAIAPLATIYHIYRYNSITKKADVPVWILLIGGFGIVIGLATWGYKIIDRMGRELTKISPSRGFIIELSAALTVIIASRSEIPVSTTHCQVGSIVGCGLLSGMKNIKWDLFRKIVMSWLITLPVTGLLSAALFSYGYYSP